MATNDYNIEVTPELKAQGEAAAAAIKQALQQWGEFIEAATGDNASGDNTGEYLSDAADEADIDVLRFTDVGER